MSKTLGEYMAEEKPINRWFMLIVGLVGAFCGAVLAILFALLGIIS